MRNGERAAPLSGPGKGGPDGDVDSSYSSSVCSGDDWAVETHGDLRLGGELGGSGGGVNFVCGCLPRPSPSSGMERGQLGATDGQWMGSDGGQ